MPVDDREEKKTKPRKRTQRARGKRCAGCGGTAAAGPGARQNAPRKGLRAKTYSLPHETEDAAERADAWHDHYRPESPTALHLTNEAARASVLADRVEAFRQACIEHQVDKVIRNQKRRGPRRIKAILARRPADGRETLRAMERFSEGCAEIASNLRDLRDTVTERGYLVPGELKIVFVWYGIWPVEESLATHVTGYTLYMLNLRCTPEVAPEEWATRLDPANRPVVLRGISSEDLVPADPRVCAERLYAMFEKKRAEYLAEADRLRREVEEPAYRRKLKKASILTGADARWASRNYTDARIGFDRAHKALYQTLERDRGLKLDREDHNGPSGPSGSEESSGSAGAALEVPSDPVPVPPEEVTPSPAEGAGTAADARTEGDQKSPNETRIAPLDLMEVPPSQRETAQEPSPDEGVPFCAPGGVAAPPTNPRPAPSPQFIATSGSAIQSRFHGPGPIPGPLQPPAILVLCLLALGCLALRAAHGPAGYLQRTISVPRWFSVRFAHPTTTATSLAIRPVVPERRFQPRRE
jgi:hypothetical protein